MESFQQGKIIDLCASTVWFGQMQARKETFLWVPHAKCFPSVLDGNLVNAWHYDKITKMTIALKLITNAIFFALINMLPSRLSLCSPIFHSNL
jgi:hypothetical protein